MSMKYINGEGGEKIPLFVGCSDEDIEADI